jgi:ketosteroid isomerase-like protein
MSQENVELVTSALRAATARPKPDFATMNEVFHPDHVFVPLNTIDTDEVRGGRGYRAFLREQVQAGDADSAAGEASTSWEADLEGAVDVGPSKVLCVLILRVRGSASGVDIESRTWIVATVRDGRVSRTELYSDPATALEAVGLREGDSLSAE